MDQLVPDPRGYWRHHPASSGRPSDVAAERARWQDVLVRYLSPDHLEAAMAEVVEAEKGASDEHA